MRTAFSYTGDSKIYRNWLAAETCTYFLRQRFLRWNGGNIMVELDSNFVMNTVFPRVMKAGLWGAFTFMTVYYLPLALLPSNIPQNILSFNYKAQLLDFALISVFFAIAGQLFSKTVIGCGFGIARALVIVAYFLVISGGGILTLTVPISEFTLNLTIDISIILLMIVAVNLLSIAKNLLEAINILTENSTNIDLT
jgi:hypothetical protein